MEIRECSRPNASSPPWPRALRVSRWQRHSISLPVGSKYNINTVRVSNLRVFSSAAHMKHSIIVNKVVPVERLTVGHSAHTGNEMCFPYIEAAIQ